MVRVGLYEKVIFNLGLEWQQGTSSENRRRKITDSGKEMCKGYTVVICMGI